MKNYDIGHFNKYGVLGIHPLLTATFIYLTRHTWLSVAVMMSRSPDLMQRSLDGSLKYLIAAEVPALLVALAAANRKPTAGRWIRAVWRVGAWACALSAVVGAVLLPLVPDFQYHPYRMDELAMLEIGFNLACAVYVLLPRSRHTFGEFPAPPPPEPERP